MIDSTCTPKDKDEDDEETTDEERGSGEEGGEFIAEAEDMNEIRIRTELCIPKQSLRKRQRQRD